MTIDIMAILFSYMAALPKMKRSKKVNEEKPGVKPLDRFFPHTSSLSSVLQE